MRSPSGALPKLTFNRINNLWRSSLKWLLILMMALLLGIMMTQVVMRYGFNNSLIWAEEICRYLLIWLSMLALLFAYERGEVAAVRMVLYALPRKFGYIAAILGNLLAAGFCFLLVYYGYVYASIAGSQPIPAFRFIENDLFGDSVANIPTVFWVYAVLPFGIGLLGLKILVECYFYIKEWPGNLTLDEFHASYDAPSVQSHGEVSA